MIRPGGVRPTKVCRPNQKRTVRSTRVISGIRASSEWRFDRLASPSAAARPRRAPARRPRSAPAGGRGPGPARSGWASASRSCSAAPSRTLSSSSGGAATAGRSRAGDRPPPGPERGDRLGLVVGRVAAGPRHLIHDARDGARPQRPPDAQRPTPHQRQQKLRDERARHRLRPGARAREAPERHRPEGLVLDLDWLLRLALRPPDRLQVGQRRLELHQQAAIEGDDRLGQDAHRRRAAVGEQHHGAPRGAEPFGQELGRRRGTNLHPEGNQDLWRAELVERPERNPVEHVGRAHQDAAFEQHDAVGAQRRRRQRVDEALQPDDPPPRNERRDGPPRVPPGSSRSATARSGRPRGRGLAPIDDLGGRRPDPDEILDRRQRRRRRHLGHPPGAKR